jgi:uncharacterized protein
MNIKKERFDLKDYISSCNTLDEWDRRKLLIRSIISKKTGIIFDKPAKRVICHETNITECGNIIVKNVYWQTLENYYVAGNIFMPKKIDVLIPAVMLPHGHFDDDRFYIESSNLATTLAGLGCMVATYDMVGKGEDKETPHDNKYNNAIQLHNSIRILDYICTLNYIDRDRIAITGASGGGSQTMMLAGMDSRIKAAIPVCMLSAHFNGGCLCEMGMNYFEDNGFQTTLAEIAAMIAPRDMLVISIGTDWTKNTPKVEFPYLQSVYQYYSAANKVSNAHFASEHHDYGLSKRTAAVEFLTGLFKLDTIQNSDMAIPSTESLKSYNEKNPKPADALSNPKEIYKQILEYYCSL